MKKILLFAVFLQISMTMMAQSKINMTIGGTTVSVTLVDNQATQSLLKHLEEEDVTVNTHRYGGFEQVGSFPWTLPASNTQITTSPGDVILYSGNQLVVFFGSNSWSYTRLGKIDGMNVNQMRSLLNVGNCTIVLSLPEATGIHSARETSKKEPSGVYDMQGRKVADRYENFRNDARMKGIYIADGKKIIL